MSTWPPSRIPWRSVPGVPTPVLHLNSSPMASRPRRAFRPRWPVLPWRSAPNVGSPRRPPRCRVRPTAPPNRPHSECATPRRTPALSPKYRETTVVRSTFSVSSKSRAMTLAIPPVPIIAHRVRSEDMTHSNHLVPTGSRQHDHSPGSRLEHVGETAGPSGGRPFEAGARYPPRPPSECLAADAVDGSRSPIWTRSRAIKPKCHELKGSEVEFDGARSCWPGGPRFVRAGRCESRTTNGLVERYRGRAPLDPHTSHRRTTTASEPTPPT